jgi:hypothetical protein
VLQPKELLAPFPSDQNHLLAGERTCRNAVSTSSAGTSSSFSRTPGSQWTLRWREMDSNHRSPAAIPRAIAMISSAFLLNARLPRAAGMARAARGRSRFDLVSCAARLSNPLRISVALGGLPMISDRLSIDQIDSFIEIGYCVVRGLFLRSRPRLLAVACGPHGGEPYKAKGADPNRVSRGAV